jgi:hypothetical protein
VEVADRVLLAQNVTVACSFERLHELVSSVRQRISWQVYSHQLLNKTQCYQLTCDHHSPVLVTARELSKIQGGFISHTIYNQLFFLISVLLLFGSLLLSLYFRAPKFLCLDFTRIQLLLLGPSHSLDRRQHCCSPQSLDTTTPFAWSLRTVRVAHNHRPRKSQREAENSTAGSSIFSILQESSPGCHISPSPCARSGQTSLESGLDGYESCHPVRVGGGNSLLT